MAEPWSAQEAGAELLAAVTRAISEEQMRARAVGRLVRNSDLARAVLASPAMRESAMRTVDATLGDFGPRLAEMVATGAGPIVAAATAPLREALRGHMHSFTDHAGVELCGGCLRPSPCPDAVLAEEPK